MKLIQSLILISTLVSCSVFIPDPKPVPRRKITRRLKKLSFRKMERKDRMNCVRRFIELGVKPVEANDVCKDIFQ